jgi:hypothetical protein
MRYLDSCPLEARAPYGTPWRRVTDTDVHVRIREWLAELVPGVVFDMVEWVSADTRRPLHAVVITVNAPAPPGSRSSRKRTI